MRTATFLLLALGVPVFAQDATVPFYKDKLNLLTYQTGGQTVPVNTVADWEKRRAHVLANMQRVMGQLPASSRAVPPAMRVEKEESLGNVVRQTVTFSAEAGDRVTAYLLRPRGVKDKTAAVLCLHQTTSIGKGEPAGVGGLKNLQYALELAQRGYVTLAPDYPNFGDYKLDVYAKGYASATMKGVWNHMRAIDLLQSLPEVDPDRIGCIGHSLGGHNTLFLAAFDPRVKVAVTSCGFNSFAKYYKGDLKGWSHKGYMPRIADQFGATPAKMPFDFTEILGVIAPRAVFVNAPIGDDNFEVSGVKDCLRAARPVYWLYNAGDRLDAIYPEAAHDFPPDARDEAYAFIHRHLRPRR